MRHPRRNGGRSQVQIDSVVSRDDFEMLLGRRRRERGQDVTIRRVVESLRARARVERVQSIPEKPETTHPTVVRREIPKAYEVLVLDVHDDDGLNAHLFSHHVHRYAVQISTIDEQLAVFVPNGW